MNHCMSPILTLSRTNKIMPFTFRITHTTIYILIRTIQPITLNNIYIHTSLI